MGEIHYLISDASKKVDVEAHVLRYWEEELELQIPRNEMGHRYYTEEYIRLFCHIKELKDNGYQLKAIKNNLPKLKEMEEEAADLKTFIGPLPAERRLTEAIPGEYKREPAELIQPANGQEVAAEDKMVQFQNIMGNIISQALRDNAELLGREVENRVSDKVIK